MSKSEKRYHMIDNGDQLLCWDYKDEQMYRLDKETKFADKIRASLMQMLKFNPYIESLGRVSRAPAWVTEIVDTPKPSNIPPRRRPPPLSLICNQLQPD